MRLGIKFSPMRRGPIERLRQLLHVDPVGNLERGFAHGVLALVTVLAKADRPAVAWFFAHRSIGSRADMSAFDGRLRMTGRTSMAPDPFSVRRASPAAFGFVALVLDASW